MSLFRYQIADARGIAATGVIQASHLMAAADQLRARGSVILELAPAELAEKAAAAKPTSFERGPSKTDIANFTRQLAVMVRAGITIRVAVEGIAEQIENRKFREMLIHIRKTMEGGQPFSYALSRYPKYFSPLYVNMVRASEMSGGFPRMLERIASYLLQQIETRNMLLGAMIYPAIIGIMAVATTIFLLTFVLPKFMTLFAGKQALLPMSTQILIGISHFMRECWYVPVLAVAATAALIVVGFRSPAFCRRLDQLKLKIPFLKRMFRALYISRSLHTMGQLVNAGVPILDTLAITAEVTGNSTYRQLWQSVYGAVKQGKKIAAPLQQSPLLPRAVVQMISAGEESAKLGEVLDEISDFYWRELRAAIKTVTSLIEPLMILLMGGIVGFIAMSIVLPIFKLSSIMSH